MDYIEYQTKDGDRWDLIAWKMYGDPWAYEGILRANPEVTAEAVLAGGVTLKVPVLEVTTTVEDFGPWKS